MIRYFCCTQRFRPLIMMSKDWKNLQKYVNEPLKLNCKDELNKNLNKNVLESHPQAG